MSDSTARASWCASSCNQTTLKALAALISAIALCTALSLSPVHAYAESVPDESFVAADAPADEAPAKSEEVTSEPPEKADTEAKTDAENDLKPDDEGASGAVTSNDGTDSASLDAENETADAENASNPESPAPAQDADLDVLPANTKQANADSDDTDGTSSPVAIDGKTLFRNPNVDPEDDPDAENRGAFIEIFNVEHQEDGSVLVSNAVNREGDNWGDYGIYLHFFELGTSSKWLLEWDGEFKGKEAASQGAFKISAVIDQGNNCSLVDPPDPESTVYQSQGPYLWTPAKYFDEASSSDGEYIQALKPISGSEAYQRWILWLNEDGTYLIQNAGSFLYVCMNSKGELIQGAASKALTLEIDLLSPKAKDEYFFGYADPWMAALPDDIYLSSVNIPGTHDTGTAHTTNSLGDLWSQDQKNYFVEQLNAGVRYFDIRAHAEDDYASPSQVTLCHTETCKDRDGESLTLQRVWDYCRAFLKEKPSEIIILGIGTDEGVDSSTFREQGVAWAMAQLINAEFHNPEDRYLWRGDMVPLVGEARGKIVLWRSFNLDPSEKGINLAVNFPDLSVYDFGLDRTGKDAHGKEDDGKGEHYAVPVYTNSDHYPADSEGSRICAYIQHVYQTKVSNKWDYITGTLDQAAGKTEHPYGDGLVYMQNMTNCTGVLNIHDTIDSSRTINSKIYENEGDYFTNNFTGIIGFNYVDKPLCRMVYMTNFADGADFFVWHPSDDEIVCTAQVYDGTPKEPVVVYCGGKLLVKDTDYQIAYENNIGPGQAYYHITFLGRYGGTADGGFMIMVDPEAKFLENATKPYDGNPVNAPAVSTVPGYDGELWYLYYYNGIDGSYTIYPPVEVGDYILRVVVTETHTYLHEEIYQNFSILPCGLVLSLETKATEDGARQVVCNLYPSDSVLSGGDEPKYVYNGSVSFEVTFPDGGESQTYVRDVEVVDGVARAILTFNVGEAPAGDYTVKATYLPGNPLRFKGENSPVAAFTKELITTSIKALITEIKMGAGANFTEMYAVVDEQGNVVARNEADMTYEIYCDKIGEAFDDPTATFMASDSGLHTRNAGVIIMKVSFNGGGVSAPCEGYFPVIVKRKDMTATTYAKDAEGKTVTEGTYGDLDGIEYALKCHFDGSYHDPPAGTFKGELSVVTLDLKTNASYDPYTIELLRIGSPEIFEYDGVEYTDLFICRNYRIIPDLGSFLVNHRKAHVAIDDATGYYGGVEPEYTYHVVSGLAPFDQPEDLVIGGHVGIVHWPDYYHSSYDDLKPKLVDGVEVPYEGALDFCAGHFNPNYYVETDRRGDLLILRGDLPLDLVVNDWVYDGKVHEKFTMYGGQEFWYDPYYTGWDPVYYSGDYSMVYYRQDG